MDGLGGSWAPDGVVAVGRGQGSLCCGAGEVGDRKCAEGEERPGQTPAGDLEGGRV